MYNNNKKCNIKLYIIYYYVKKKIIYLILDIDNIILYSYS